jgi:hypothetical protein
MGTTSDASVCNSVCNVVMDSSTACNSMLMPFSATVVYSDASYEEEQRQALWYQGWLTRPDLFATARRLALKLDRAERNMRRARKDSFAQRKWYTRVQYFGERYDRAEQRFLDHVETL